MPNDLELINTILAEADQKLLRLIAERATAGDLSGVDAARTVALQLRAIMAGSSNRQSEVSTSLRTTKENSRRKKKDSKKSKIGRGSYPRFDVRNTTLYRIGWSKKKKESYSHKVPQRIVFEVVQVMAALSSGGPGPFTAEQIINRVNENSSVSIPSYQAYVVIGFLRSRSLIEQVGRDGYRIPEGVVSMVKALWASMDADQS